LKRLKKNRCNKLTIQYKRALKKHVSWIINGIAECPWGEIEIDEK